MNKQELKYILFSIGFAVIWFFLVMPYLIESIDGNSPYMQFLLCNVGLIIFLQIALKSFTLKTKISLFGSIGLVTLFIALDILQPPYAVLSDGTLISSGPALIKSSSDYIAGLMGQTIGLSGTLLFGFVYIVIPAFLLYISAKLIPNFVREI